MFVYLRGEDLKVLKRERKDALHAAAPIEEPALRKALWLLSELRSWPIKLTSITLGAMTVLYLLWP